MFIGFFYLEAIETGGKKAGIELHLKYDWKFSKCHSGLFKN